MKNTVPDVFIFTRDTLAAIEKVLHQDFFRDSLERPALKSTPEAQKNAGSQQLRNFCKEKCAANFSAVGELVRVYIL